MKDGLKALPVEVRSRLHADLVDYALFPSCMNCEHNAKHIGKFDPKYSKAPDTWCSQYNAVPPIEVIVCGCPGWIQAIPF
jgi:hypothetical protein